MSTNNLLNKDVSKFTPRAEQQTTLDTISPHFDDPNIKFYLLDLPVGTGKSHLALMIAKQLMKFDETVKFDIITATKLLQDQYANTYSSLANIKGRENYTCSHYGTDCSKGKDMCAALKRDSCPDCPYNRAKREYCMATLGLTNFYMYLTESIYVKKQSRDSKVLIIDEGHLLEQLVSEYVSIKISEAILAKCGLSDAVKNDLIARANLCETIKEYADFVRTYVEELSKHMAEVKTKIAEHGDFPSEAKMKTLAKYITQFEESNRQVKKCSEFFQQLDNNPTNWVLEKTYNEKTKKKETSIEPIWSKEFMDDFIWSKYDKVFIMSGTILDKEVFCQINGIDQSSTIYVSIPSPFALENRPIHYIPMGKMSYAKKAETFDTMVPMIKKILEKHSGQKGIIHTNSFELASWIMTKINDPRLMTHTSSNKDEVLAEHFATSDPTVLVSPSMSTGVSLDDDYSRFQIIIKIPYLALSSTRIKSRLDQMPTWYQMMAVSELIQACGRSVRSHTDSADTYILDGSFTDLLRNGKRFFPKWFLESITQYNI